jgi:Zn-dependent peptidase ImmA (M78 family)/transcriptional regulator with XRE-family HTH domain
MVTQIHTETRNLPKPIPERIREARESRGFSSDEFSERIGVTRQALSKFESGLLAPSGETMRKIIAETGLPPSFFVATKQRSANGIAPFWRGLKRMEVHHRKRMTRRLEWLGDLTTYVSEFVDLPDVSLPQIDFDHTSSNMDQVERAAESLRDHWKLGREPVHDVSALMENNGVILARESVVCDDMDAVSCWQFGRPFVLYSADVESGPRNYFNLAHELAHVLLHSSVEVSVDNIALVEKQANRFASAFLMPQTSFSREVLGTSLNHFLMLKERWGVSIAAMAYRCKDLGMFNSHQHTYVMKQLNSKGIRTKEPLDDYFPVRSPNLVSSSFRLLLDNNITSPSEIIDALALNPEDIESLGGLEKGTLNTTVVHFRPKLINT